MKSNFNTIYDQLKNITFESEQSNVISNIQFSIIKRVLCVRIASYMTSKNMSKSEVDQYFKEALNLSQDKEETAMNEDENSLYLLIRDPKRIKKALCLDEADPDLTEEQQSNFRDCVNQLYPQITEAAQNIKERIEMKYNVRKKNPEDGHHKSVKWADLYPHRRQTRNSYSSSIELR